MISSVQENIKVEVPFAKTVTFQTSFFIRSCKVWNILDIELIDRNTNLSTFRIWLKAFYMRALSNVFNSEDLKTWRSWKFMISIKNVWKARKILEFLFLLKIIHCLFLWRVVRHNKRYSWGSLKGTYSFTLIFSILHCLFDKRK